MKPSLLGELFLLRRLENILTTTGGELFHKVQPLFPKKYVEGNDLGLNMPRWSFSLNGLHGPQKEANEMM